MKPSKLPASRGGVYTEAIIYPDQLKPNPYVEKSRAMQRNDTENIPVFLISALLFAWTQPPLVAAQLLMYGYVASRMLHFYAIATARIHDIRATFWTIGSCIVIGMSAYTLIFVLGK